MPAIAKPFITHAKDSPAYWQIGNLWKAMATGVQTDNSFTLLDQVVHTGGGGGRVTHTHTQDEGLGHQGMAGTSGTVVATPGDCEHSLTFDETEIQVLNFYLPTGFEQLLIGVSHPAEERGPPPQELIGKMLPPKALSAKLAADYGQFNMLSDPFTDPPDPNNIATRPTPGATVFPFTANVEDAIQSHWLMGGLWKILASGDQTGGSHCLIELVLRKGPTAAPHQHADSDEVVYILEGEMSFLLGDRIERASKGALVFIPRGYVHGVHVENEEAHSLNLHTPSGFKKFVELVGTPAAEKTLPPASLKDRDVDAGTRSRLMNEIGMRGVAVADPLT